MTFSLHKFFVGNLSTANLILGNLLSDIPEPRSRSGPSTNTDDATHAPSLSQSTTHAPTSQSTASIFAAVSQSPTHASTPTNAAALVQFHRRQITFRHPPPSLSDSVSCSVDRHSSRSRRWSHPSSGCWGPCFSDSNTFPISLERKMESVILRVIPDAVKTLSEFLNLMIHEVGTRRMFVLSVLLG
ncbi:hypothetical protein AKJ16_DCAP00984 [Drosera capensis]